MSEPFRGITFRHDFKLWWPDYDHKPIACHKRVTKRQHDLIYAVALCKERRVCVQAGGHAGVWPMYLDRYFDRVYTFEPEPALFECLSRNILRNAGPRFGIIASPYALGAYRRTGMMLPHISAGSWRVDGEVGSFPITIIAIDELKLPHCDLIVLDIEGYEVEALKGAMHTIMEHRPIIHIEELDRSKQAIRDHLSRLGYMLYKRVHSDAVYIPG